MERATYVDWNKQNICGANENLAKMWNNNNYSELAE